MLIFRQKYFQFCTPLEKSTTRIAIIWEFQFFLLRFLDGVADAASWCAGVSILMKLFPNKVSQIMSWTEMLFGLGYMLGK